MLLLFFLPKHNIFVKKGKNRHFNPGFWNSVKKKEEFAKIFLFWIWRLGLLLQVAFCCCCCCCWWCFRFLNNFWNFMPNKEICQFLWPHVRHNSPLFLLAFIKRKNKKKNATFSKQIMCITGDVQTPFMSFIPINCLIKKHLRTLILVWF